MKDRDIRVPIFGMGREVAIERRIGRPRRTVTTSQGRFCRSRFSIWSTAWAELGRTRGECRAAAILPTLFLPTRRLSSDRKTIIDIAKAGEADREEEVRAHCQIADEEGGYDLAAAESLRGRSLGRGNASSAPTGRAARLVGGGQPARPIGS
jgi:hypothetical protein